MYTSILPAIKKLLLLIGFLSIGMQYFAQSAAQGFSYQAVARDQTGTVIGSHNLTVRFTLHLGNPTGQTVWQEAHTVQTNAYGLFTTTIGTGTSTGTGSAPTFAGINWAAGTHFMQVESDFGAGFVDMGTSQLLTVPYAVLADSALKSPATTPYTAGNGIDINNHIVTNTGDLDGNDDVNIGMAAAGDLSGTYPSPSVAGIQGNPVSSVQPLVGQLIQWTGTEWTPMTLDSVAFADTAAFARNAPWLVDGNIVYYENGKVGIGNHVAPAPLSLGTGSFSVLGPQNSPVAPLQFDNALDAAGTGTANKIVLLDVPGSGRSGLGVSVDDMDYYSTGNHRFYTNHIDETTEGNEAMSILQSGNVGIGTSTPSQTLEVNGKIRVGNDGNPASLGTMRWDGSDLQVYESGRWTSLIGDTLGTDDVLIGSLATGDLDGTYPNPSVAGIRGRQVSAAAPLLNEVLKWNGTVWEPAVDQNTTYSAGAGLELAGTIFSNTGDRDSTNDITNSTNAGGDLAGIYPNPRVTRIQNQPVSNTAPATGQLLVWNGSQYVPATAGGDLTGPYTGITTIGIQGRPVVATAPATGQSLIWNGTSWAPTTLSGDLTGAYAANTVVKIQNRSVAATAPTTGQAYMWSGTQWVPVSVGGDVAGNLDNQTVAKIRNRNVSTTAPLANDILVYNGGTSTWTPTAGTDLVAADDIKIGDAATGDLTGTYPAPVVAKLQGKAISSNAPTTGQMLMWDGNSWLPVNTGGDLTGAVNAATVVKVQGRPVAATTPTPGQAYMWNGTTWTPVSLGGDLNGAIDAATVTKIQGSAVSATPPIANNVLVYNNALSRWEPQAGVDLVAADDIKIGDAAAGDITGTFPTLTVSKIQGRAVAATAPASGDIFVYNFGTSTWVPTAGADLAEADDMNIGDAAGGDLSATYPNPTVSKLRGITVSPVVPTNGQVLRLDAGQWTPKDDTWASLDTNIYRFSGRVGIGTSTPVTKLTVNGTITPGTDNAWNLGSGSLRWKNIFATNAVIQTSDARQKTNVSAIGYGLEDVLKMRAVSFNWINDPQGKSNLGVIAQEMEQLIPEVVVVADDAEKTYGVKYSDLVPVLIKAIQDQQNIIDGQGKDIESLKASLRTVEAQLNTDTAGK